MRLQWLINDMAVASGRRLVSMPRYSWLLSSPQEAFAMYRKRIYSLGVCRSKPSAIFDETESEERKIWVLKKVVLQSFIAKNKLPFRVLDSCQTTRSSNRWTLLWNVFIGIDFWIKNFLLPNERHLPISINGTKFKLEHNLSSSPSFSPSTPMSHA